MSRSSRSGSFRGALLLLSILTLGMLALTVERLGAAGAVAAPAMTSSSSKAGQERLELWGSVPSKRRGASRGELGLRVQPGDEAEAKAYYKAIRADHLANFPKATLEESTIADMMQYFGISGLSAEQLEELPPASLDRQGIVAVRFFAPKIVNVREHAVPPKDGYGWRKIVRMRAQEGSRADKDGLDSFYLLFNFTSQLPAFPAGEHAGQIQTILVPRYTSPPKHRDVYFLVYQPLKPPNPGKVGFFLKASFDLAGIVPDDKYYVPRSCSQCHGTSDPQQKGAKVNYLDTDHWFDRAGDADFPAMPKGNVLVDGKPSYNSFRKLNQEIRDQNEKVGGDKFALLAASKWLDLHKEGGQFPTEPAPPLARGFGDKIWQDQAPDKELLPLLNQNCFRCHSSIRFHVFDKNAVLLRKQSILRRLASEDKAVRMPQDRVLTKEVKDNMIRLMTSLSQ